MLNSVVVIKFYLLVPLKVLNLRKSSIFFFPVFVEDERLYKRLCPSVRWSVGEHESTGIGRVSGLVSFFLPSQTLWFYSTSNGGGESSQLFRRLIITAPALLLDKSYHYCSWPHAWLALPSLFLPICLISLTTSGTFDVDRSFPDWSPINKPHQQTGQTGHLRNFFGNVWMCHG